VGRGPYQALGTTLESVPAPLMPLVHYGLKDVDLQAQGAAESVREANPVSGTG
jgi:hypothetical protein